MNKDIIYESETDDTRLILSRIGAFVIFAIIIAFERWFWKFTSFTPLFFFLLFSGVVLAFLGTPLFYLIRYVSLSRPALKIFQDKLCVGDKVIPFNEIENIILINDKPWFSKWSWPEESVTIKLNTGQDITIIVSRYSNGNLFRTFCEKIKADITTGKFELNTVTPPHVILNPVSFAELGDENFKDFRPNLFASISFYYSLFLVVATVMVLSGPIENAPYSTNIIFFVFFAAIFLTLAILQKYFLVSDKYLVIKYYLYFWKATIFRIADIRKIEILNVHRAKKLLITTKDYKIHPFIIDSASFSKKINEMIQTVNEYAGIKSEPE